MEWTPRSANASAAAAPMPELAPVTMAILRIGFSLQQVSDEEVLAPSLRTIYNAASDFHYGSSRMDPLAAVIAALRPRAAAAKIISGGGKWGARYAQVDSAGFGLVLAGACWLRIEEGGPLRLAE